MVVLEAGEVMISTSPGQTRKSSPSLLKVSRQIFCEAAPIFWGNNTIILRNTTMYDFEKRWGLVAMKLIRHLKLVWSNYRHHMFDITNHQKTNLCELESLELVYDKFGSISPMAVIDIRLFCWAAMRDLLAGPQFQKLDQATEHLGVEYLTLRLLPKSAQLRRHVSVLMPGPLNGALKSFRNMSLILIHSSRTSTLVTIVPLRFEVVHKRFAAVLI